MIQNETIRLYDPERATALEGGFLHYFRRALKHNRRKDAERETYQIKCGMNLTEHARKRLREIERFMEAHDGICVDYGEIAEAMRVSKDTVIDYIRLYKLSNSISIDCCDESESPFQLSDPDGDIWKQMEESDSKKLRKLLHVLVCGIEATAKAQTKPKTVFYVYAHPNDQGDADARGN